MKNARPCFIEGRIAASKGKVLDEGKVFARVSRREGGTYQRVEFEATDESAWLIFNEAWHPDWTACEVAANRILSRGRSSLTWILKNGSSGNCPSSTWH